MAPSVKTSTTRRANSKPYVLDEQIGFILRQVSQRHTTIFAGEMSDDLTPMQWAALSKLHEKGDCSQNLLGRLTAMDGATIKGVIERLRKQGLVDASADSSDGRRLVVRLTDGGVKAVQRALPHAARITEQTLAPLSPRQRDDLLGLLKALL